MIKETMYFAPCNKTWSEILQNPSNIRVEEVLTGYVYVKKNTIIKTKERVNLKLPIYAFVIKHPKGNYLVDVGIDKSFYHNKLGSQKGIIKHFLACPCEIGDGQTIAEYLEKQDIKLDGIFLSHLHFDHIAGLIDMPEYTTCMVGEGEKYYEEKPLYYGDQLKHIETMKVLSFSGQNELIPLGRCIDFFGDGSFIIISTPGHTAGHLSFFINKKDDPVLLACDGYSYGSDELLEKGPGSYTSYFEIGDKTAKDLVNFCSEYKIRLVPGHGSK
jgi:glyoxylase-like metal-dependent hydrolase (beta-lactamase superfamily II)